MASDGVGSTGSIAEAIVDILCKGKSVFLTGGGGTGKTWTTREIICLCAERGKIRVTQCATTGIAAIQLPNGRTLHSTFCLPIDYPNESELIMRVRRLRRSVSPKAKLAVLIANQTDILIIDEISMASAWLMDTLDLYLRILRHKNEPFGGIRILAVGDFLQLPPVYRKGDGSSPPLAQKNLAVESNVWKTTLPQTVLLTEVKRQSDRDFMELLGKIRFGFTLTIRENKILSEKSKKKEVSASEEERSNDAMHIAVRRKDVFEINENRFRMLEKTGATMRQYPFPTTKMGPTEMLDELEKDLRENLYLSQKSQKQKFIVGQRVMCISNIDNNGISLVNGDTGTIVKFHCMPSNAPCGTWVLYLETAIQLTLDDDTYLTKMMVPVVQFDRLNQPILVASKKFSREIPNTKSSHVECYMYGFQYR